MIIERYAEHATHINEAYNNIDTITPNTNQYYHESIQIVIDGLDRGELFINEKHEGTWSVNEYLKKAILLAFRIWPGRLHIGHGALCSSELAYIAYDKVPLKFADWLEEDFKKHAIRCVPGSIVRKGSYISKGAILMPCFINIGAYIGTNTMIDTWSTVGSCAHIGNNCHISGGVGIGGVLEPLQARPVIIEDNCFIGARCEIAEGVLIGNGSVIGMGTKIGMSTRIICRDTGQIYFGEVPPHSVVVPGSYKYSDNLSIGCAVIIKKVDASTLSKTQINELLRIT